MYNVRCLSGMWCRMMEILLSFLLVLGARCSPVVERSLILRCFVGSILHDGVNELFRVPASAP